MTEKQHQGKDLDDLLKKAFTDDLPTEVAAGMRDRIDRFRAWTMKEEGRTAAWGGLFRKSAWAALSVLMLVCGSLLQGLGVRSPLADGISLIETRQAVENRLASVKSMSCLARVRNETGEFLSMTIFWRSGEVSEARVSKADGSLLGTFKIGGRGEIGDSRVRAAAPFSNPEAVRSLLAGEWRMVKFSEEAERQTGIFTTAAGAGADRLEFAIDLGTFLPLHVARRTGGSTVSGGMADIVWEARFTF